MWLLQLPLVRFVFQYLAFSIVSNAVDKSLLQLLNMINIQFDQLHQSNCFFFSYYCLRKSRTLVFISRPARIFISPFNFYSAFNQVDGFLKRWTNSRWFTRHGSIFHRLNLFTDSLLQTVMIIKTRQSISFIDSEIFQGRWMMDLTFGNQLNSDWSG